VDEADGGLLALACLGRAANDDACETLFNALQTLHRPALADDDPPRYHDWIRIRRKGMELGFTDQEYQAAAARHRWGLGPLILTQVYFYSAHDELRPYRGALPYGLSFDDDRNRARAKLHSFGTTRHSHLTDTWDVEGYRLNLVYADDGRRIDRLACRVMPRPIKPEQPLAPPPLGEMIDSLGAPVTSSAFTTAWGAHVEDTLFEYAIEDGEIDLSQTLGLSMQIARDGNTDPYVRALTLHRNRDCEAVGWSGLLPFRLDFEDSPEVLLSKVRGKPKQQADSALTGFARWPLERYDLHVLYSNVDNRLLRITLSDPRGRPADAIA
jgi:hypothetical protein